MLALFSSVHGALEHQVEMGEAEVCDSYLRIFLASVFLPLIFSIVIVTIFALFSQIKIIRFERGVSPSVKGYSTIKTVDNLFTRKVYPRKNNLYIVLKINSLLRELGNPKMSQVIFYFFVLTLVVQDLIFFYTTHQIPKINVDFETMTRVHPIAILYKSFFVMAIIDAIIVYFLAHHDFIISIGSGIAILSLILTFSLCFSFIANILSPLILLSCICHFFIFLRSDVSLIAACINFLMYCQLISRTFSLVDIFRQADQPNKRHLSVTSRLRFQSFCIIVCAFMLLTYIFDYI
jgi:hypothetical protein